MNVSAADILAAYIFVFGVAMDPHKAFAKGGEEIRTARKDWKSVFTLIASTRVQMEKEGRQYPDYADVAARAKSLLTMD